jgi:hypothetical protein
MRCDAMRELQSFLRFSGSLLRLLLLFLLVATGSVLRVEATNNADVNNAVVIDTALDTNTATRDDDRGRGSSSNPPTKPLAQRPTIYTYFERIDVSNRTTGMTDDEDFDLLRFWKERWKEAGYTPMVLTAETVTASFPPPPLQFPNKTTNTNTNNNQTSHYYPSNYFTKDRYESIRSKLETLPLDDFGKILFRRWMAMAAVGGGWFSDYDNFPLWDLDVGSAPEPKPEMTLALMQLPNGEKMTLHDIFLQRWHPDRETNGWIPSRHSWTKPTNTAFSLRETTTSTWIVSIPTHWASIP